MSRLSIRCVAAPLLLATLIAFPGRAREMTQFDTLWITPPGAPAERRVRALLSQPAGWMPGDAAVVLVGGWSGAEPARGGLIAAFLDAGAAVVEVDPYTPRGFAADGGANPPAPTAAALAADLAGAADALRLVQGAGLLVTVGFGLGGDAALLAAAEARRIGRDTPDGESGFAAGAAFDGGPARFAAGAPPPAFEGWAERAPQLCGLLAEAGPVLDSAATGARCTAALLPTPDAVAEAVPPARGPALAAGPGQ